MKKITKMIGFMLAIVLIISIFPAARTEAATYKLSLTGKYDLSDDDKVIYNYSKMMKNVKLEKVEGKNQWNLTMYAGTTVCLPYTVTATTDEVKITSASTYVSGASGYVRTEDYSYIKVTADQSSYKLTKTVTNKVLTCKAYNEAGKCLSTLKIVVKVLPYNAKLERSKLVTAEELYKLNFHKDNYSEFAWKNVISKYPEILLDGSYSPLYTLAKHVVVLDAYGRQVPQYLYDKFEAEDVEELDNILYGEEPSDVWNYDYDLIEAAINATSQGYQRESKDILSQLRDIIGGLELSQYDTDWEKVLEIQKWVKANVKYKLGGDASLKRALTQGYAQCSGYAQLMLTMCQLIDIPCYIVIDPHGVYGYGHAWNIVLVDGLWCTMDLTGDVGFGVVTTSGFTREPNVRAVLWLVEVFGGEALEEYDNLPEYVRNLIDLIRFQRGHKEYLVERYYEWLDVYDPEVDMDNTFGYYIMQRHLLKGFKKGKYEDWLQNDYNPEIHGVNALEYWYNNILSSEEQCGDCSFILKYFPEEFDTIE